MTVELNSVHLTASLFEQSFFTPEDPWVDADVSDEFEIVVTYRGHYCGESVTQVDFNEIEMVAGVENWPTFIVSLLAYTKDLRGSGCATLWDVIAGYRKCSFPHS